jgi:ribonuclease PH
MRSRTDGRKDDEARSLELIPNYTLNAPGSVLVSTDATRVICTATFEEQVPDFLKLSENGFRHGWVTAEYGMLPGSTGKRKRRERPQVDGRTQEIQRLIGRSLRSVVDLNALGRHTIWIDCDVIQADGGTRTAAITGGFVALILALRKMQKEKRFEKFPVSRFLASISVGIFEGRPLLDLKYDEDVKAEVDMNVVMLDNGDFVEVQGTAEGQTFPRKQLNQLLDFAEQGIRSHVSQQKQLLGETLES